MVVLRDARCNLKITYGKTYVLDNARQSILTYTCGDALGPMVPMLPLVMNGLTRKKWRDFLPFSSSQPFGLRM